LKNFKQILSKQSAEKRPWIIWIWNLLISKKEMLEQLNELISQGFGGIIIRPGKEMVPTYLSEEFFSLFKLVLETAKQHAIGIRIADDFSMPWSGFFDTLLEQNSTLRAQSLVLKESRSLDLKETFSYSSDDPQNTIVLVARSKGTQVSLTEVKELSFSADKSIEWKNQAGESRVFVFKKEYVHDLAGGYIPNVYNTRTAQLYIQNVLNVFKSRFSKYIGSTLQGFLTEMPAYRTGDGAIPWDDDLVVKFRTKYKKDLLKYLPSLFCDAQQAARIRNQIYAYLDQSMYERFALPIETWAKKSHLSQWVLCPERTIHRMNNPLVDGDFHTDRGLAHVGLQNLDGMEEGFPMLRAMVDVNTCEYKRGSIAVVGRNRTGSGATLQSLKNEIDKCIMSGVTEIIVDGCFYSLDQRSYLKTPHNPSWFPFLGGHFKELCNYAARMQELMHGVVFSRPVAVFSPAPAIRAVYMPTNVEAVCPGVAITQKAVNALVRQSLDFDILSEEYLVSCAVKPEGEFGKTERKGKMNYRALVVPYASLISRSLLVFLEKLVSKRGMIVFVNELPRGTFEDGVNAGVTKRIEKLLNPKKGKTCVASLDELDRVLSEIPSPVKLTAHDQGTPEILCAGGPDQGCSVYMMHNLSDHQEYTVKVELADEKRFFSIDSTTGNIVEINDIVHEENVCRFHLHMMPNRTVFIVGTAMALPALTTKQTSGMISAFTALQRNYRMILKNQWTFDASTMNALPLSSWNMRIGLSRENGGFSHFYEAQFQVGTLPGECYFAIGGSTGNFNKLMGADTQVEISVNGTRIDKPIVPAASSASLDAGGMPIPSPEVISFIVPPDQVNMKYLFGAPVTLYNIKNLLIKGFNRISFRTSSLVTNPQALMFPPLLIGRFAIVRGPNGWIIERSGATVGNDSWTKYGYPYLSGMGVYSQLFEVPHQYSRLVLRMSQVSGIVTIAINDKNVGDKFIWQPIEVDITSFCESKRNELKISVTNTIDNVLRMNGRASGILGDVYLDVT
jgi:hypothetical protein